MAQSKHKKSARQSPEGLRLLDILSDNTERLDQAQRVIANAREHRALTIQRLVAHGVSLADIAEVAEMSRTTVKRIADHQGRLTPLPLTASLRDDES